jgi:hypothetical protein
MLHQKEPTPEGEAIGKQRAAEMGESETRGVFYSEGRGGKKGADIKRRSQWCPHGCKCAKPGAKE